MKLLFRIVATLLFIVFFGFALKNTQEVALHFFLDYELRGPLVLMLLGFFIAGSVMGVLAMMPMLFRHRRDLSKHKKIVMAMKKEIAEQERVRTQPPQPDSVLDQ